MRALDELKAAHQRVTELEAQLAERDQRFRDLHMRMLLIFAQCPRPRVLP